ncbi:MAG TPA: c-type cytochrome [Bryobacteraceae bacterium]|jgi:mono/diheme cytochrome c family protein|nr:c-type cytochrome [Bryobacteraceae bacterium]
MHDLKRVGLPALLFLAPAVIHLYAQEPTVGGAAPGRGAAAAIAGSKEDPAAVERGGKLYIANCGGCHGAGARGGAGAPDLVRSVLVLDDEKGILIAPVLRDGRPDQGMPKMNLTEPQIADIVAWLHVQTYAAGHRSTYAFLDVLTGDPKKGEAYFNSTGKCHTCHSVTGDLKGIGGRYEPFPLQSRWLQPRGGRGGGGRGGRGGGAPSTSSAIIVTVTLPSGQVFSGTLDRIDDFNVSLRDSSGDYHSFTRDGATPKVEVRDPLQAHTDLLHQYTDADIHDVTAYLVTLK